MGLISRVSSRTYRFHSKRTMVFLCQKDSYLKSVNTKVLSCIPSTKFKDQFEVQFQDALIFPEGGGQPSDTGTVKLSNKNLDISNAMGDLKLENVKITNAYRQGENAISITDKPLTINTECNIEIDFNRRFDHMQQHTGQHLISAIAEKEPYLFNTTSWWLGNEYCNVEFDTKTISDKQLKEIEDKCNEAIKNGKNDIKVHVTDKTGAENMGAKTRGLPDDHVGDLRVVEIPGYDMNLCCGTHLSNLREIQMIKLINVEKGKKGKTLVNFACGNRVLKLLDKSYKHQTELISVLKCGVGEHFNKTKTMVNQIKTAERGLKSCLGDLAKLESKEFAGLDEPKIFNHHRKEGTADYLNALLRELPKNTTALITYGDEKAKPQVFGFVILSSKLEENSGEILKLLEGKGVAKNGKMQGKCNSLKKRKQILELI